MVEAQPASRPRLREGLDRHPRWPESQSDVRSNLAWGLGLTVGCRRAHRPTSGQSLSAFGLTVCYVQHSAVPHAHHGDSERSAGLYATYVVLGKMPQAVGVLAIRLNRLRGKQAALIEYK